MKRRSSLRSDSGQEERRLDGERNLRKRQWINYRDDDEDDYEEDDRNQPLTHEDGELWPVTCGVKEGMMDAQKLAKGEKCIEFEGRMFTPPAFEEFGGKGSAKKWKLSIYSGGKPLQHWFDENLLSTEGYRKGKKAYKKGQSFQNNGDNGDAQGSGESGEDATDDSENDDGIPSGCRSWLSWAEEETERNDSDHSDEKQDEELDEMENDGDGNDEDDEDLCAPQEPDPRFIISTTEKLALQMNSIVLLERISMTRSRCQTAAAEHQRKDDEEGDGDSETNRNEKTKSNEGETPQEPVDSETADVATNMSPQQEPAEQKVHELQGLPADTLTLPGSSARDGHTDVSILDPFESQTKSETRSVCDSESTHISDIVENSTSGVLTGSDVDSMDLDQLQRETLKTQLEAAREQKEASRIQKEYYALKLRLLRVRMKAGRFSSPMRAVMQRTLGGTEHFL